MIELSALLSQSVLVFHIVAGSVGLLSGAAALIYKKGSAAHKKSGQLFFISMLFMSGFGAAIAFFKPAMLSVMNGLLTFYLVATGWKAIKRKSGEMGYFEWFAFIGGALISYGLLSCGLEAANSVNGLKDGMPAGRYYFFGAIALVATLLDLKLLIQGGIKGAHRIARHLWRMCFALFMANAAFFLGQAQVFPLALRKIEILALPVVMVLILLIYWLIKILWPKTINEALAETK